MTTPSSTLQAPVSTRGVQPDGSIKFELKAPNAKAVSLNLEGVDSVPMTQGVDGKWTYTTKPLAPDIYGYSFSVDGVTVLDPANPSIKPNLIWQSNMLLVPSTPPAMWEVKDVPHGNVIHQYYKSNVIGDHRGYYVYTPPGYGPRGHTDYPVLYLLHGFSDTEDGWTAVGKANVILDNLIAEKKVARMIVVMTLGYGIPNFASPDGPAFKDPQHVKQNYDLFRESLLTEVIPRVEHDFHVIANRKNRAIAGLSMGGAEALYIGLNNLDKFGAIGSFSAGGLSEDFPVHFPKLTGENANNSLKFLTVACGTDDGLITFNRNLVAWLRSQDVKVNQVETPGRHTWMVWRRDLIDFTQKLFLKI